MPIPEYPPAGEGSMAQANNSQTHPVERRPKRRNRVLLGGIVSYAEGKHQFDCAIRDLTDKGARIVVPRNQQFPSSFYLINIRDRIAYDVKIMWNNGKEVGVSFKKTYPLADIADPALSFLKRQWLAQATR
jgi:hypothetical protein